VCAPVDVCHTAGACDPTSGACSNPALSSCTTVDRTVVSTIASTTAFLYSGSNPIQTGVAPGTVVATRAAILRGRVLDHSSSPLPGVAISILNHPEFGATTTVADGTFSMAVNGGSALTVAYAATGFLPMQRTVAHAPWNDYAMLPDVVLTAVDEATTSVTFGSTAGYQVARATTVTDDDGSRTATLLVPPGTQAEMLTGASSTPVTTPLTVRATEYTVGTTGPASMPGDLPANSGYTYAIEFTADEELALGPDASVVFATPIVSYTDNFLGFGVGQHVPVGSYSRTTAQWTGSPDGLVIGIVSITGGVANIDLNGDGIADSASALAAVGITPGEQAELGSMYSAPTSLWRVPIYHFSEPWDFNWPFGPGPGAAAPPGPDPATPAAPDCHLACCGSGGPGDPGGGPGGPNGGGGGPSGDGSSGASSGPNGTGSSSPNSSRLECENGILHESIPIAGTSYSLTYSSDRVAGYAAENRILIPLSAATLPPGVIEIDLEVDVAGQQFTASFPPSTNLNTTFDWDGNDFLGRPIQGVQTASVSVGYVYQGVYLTPGEKPVVAGNNPYNALFGHYSYFGAPATGDSSRQQITIWERAQVSIGHFGAESLGLGGWQVDAQHVYEPPTSMLRLGNGGRQPGDAFGKIVTTFAGTGAIGGAGDGGPAISANLYGPWNVAVAPDGSVYISDRNNLRIRKVDTQGVITNVVGTGSRGYNGDNIAATSANLNNPECVLVAPDGSLYFSDVANQRVRWVDPQGIIHTVAGNGSQGYSGDGGPATSAAFSNPDNLALSPDGSLYIADTLNSVIRKVDPAGIVSTVVGVAGTENVNAVNFNGDNQPAPQATVNAGRGIAISPDGVLYVADCYNHRVRRIGTDGIITTYAGTGTAGFSGDNGPATSAQLMLPLNLALSSDGTLYVSDIGTMRIRAIDPGGIITTVAGNGTVGYSGDNGPALDATFNPPGPPPAVHTFGITLGSDRLMYIADGDNNVVRRLSLSQPAFANAALSVASDDGALVYGFDAFGKHLATKTLPTGGQTLTLGYDPSSGLLTTLTDIDGNVTTIQRDGAGNPTAIVSPFGVTTQLGLGSDGYLSTVTDPTGALHQMAYQNGLLTSIQYPTGSPTIESTKTYDSLGRIATSTDAAGGTLTFSRAPDAASSVSVTKTTSQGVPTSYGVTLSPSGASSWTTSLAGASNAQTMQINADGSKSITAPDGTLTTYVGGPDPRFGMGAPLATLLTTKLPVSGTTSSTSLSRTVTLSTWPRRKVSRIMPRARWRRRSWQ
jgi:YD repeat-containing protein